MWADGALLQPLPMRTTATSGQVPQRRQSCVLRQLPRRLARGVHPRRAAHRRAAAQQLVVPRLRHRGGDAGRLKFGFPRSFFVVVTPAPGCFLGVVKNFIKARARIASTRTESPNFSAANVPFPRASDPRRSRYVSQGTRAAGGAAGAQARRTW